MSRETLLLRYHEVAIKGDNRGWFERRLAHNARQRIYRSLNVTSGVQISRTHGRILLETEWNLITKDALDCVFGLSSYSPIQKVSTEKKEILNQALAEFKKYADQYGLPKTFRVKTRRSDKALSDSSQEIDRWIGSAIRDRYPILEVDLKHPDFTLGIEIRFGKTFIWTEKIPGPGGLPVGSNAAVLCLISGGIDSPVAAIRTLRRGSPTQFIHFYGAPFVGEEALQKVEDLIRIINRYHPETGKLYVIFFGKIQEQIALVTNPKMRTILYRRMMIRIANRVAKTLKIEALVTGESLGQVASQTLENLAVIHSASHLPIFCPLITYDKDEIIQQAHQWGTFETSIRPATDCCTLFADRHPLLHTSLAAVEEEECKFSVNHLVEEALSSITPSLKPARSPVEEWDLPNSVVLPI